MSEDAGGTGTGGGTRGGPGRDDEEQRDAGRPALRPSQVRAAAARAQEAAAAGGGDSPAPAAWRVTFSYTGEKVSVVAQQHVAMLAPPDDRALVEAGSRGSWAEVRDADGTVLYAQVLHQPVRAQHEVHNRYGVAPKQVTADEVRGAFQVVVPDLPGGVELVVRGRADVDDAARKAPRQLVKVRLGQGQG
ncbi:hypothetical protein [Cellulomonas palmilytica]|uniref:hypothetical protein n=1 Tax=Cellulomonas palmilytica TaxID=2608402 RepID=UPI001F4591D4|nr:hypothetical protein [Cellulomonas palmilytica]UJP40447.1 hypothetical protein F1D97_02660 [Cellulomonas palmilytica]